MSAELDTHNTRIESWILGVYGTSFIVLLGICINCCKNKPPITARPAPPTPEASPRYESSPYPATSTARTIQRPRIESDEDFEDVPEVRIEIPAVESRHTSSNRQLAAPSATTPGEKQNQPPDYVNVNSGPAKLPESRKDHTYLEVFPADTEFYRKVATGDQTEGITARKSLNSCTATSLSLSDSHSYENITVEEAAADYVNI